MTHQNHASPAEPRLEKKAVRVFWLYGIPLSVFYTFVAITVMAIFVPLNPRMPSRGLDASWEFAMNEAVARHLSFGSNIVYTYGPYASVSTRTYDPATDRRMICGSALLAVAYIAALFFLARETKRYLMLILLVFLATFGTAEMLLLSYAFLLAVCVLKYASTHRPDSLPRLSLPQALVAVVMCSALGLLPLVKGSLLLPFTAAVAISFASLLRCSRPKQAVMVLLLPVVSCAALWALGGQSLADLPAFLRGTSLLTSGYTEAMSTSWQVLPSMIGVGFVVIYLVVSAVMCLSVYRSGRLAAASRWMLIFLCSVFLFVTFKHGFVRAEGVSGVFSSLALYILILAFIFIDRPLTWSLCAVIFLTAATSVMQDPVLNREVHEHFGAGVTWGGQKRSDIFAFCADRALAAYSRSTYKSAWHTYAQAWEGLGTRAAGSDRLGNQFDTALANIRRDYTPPSLNGTVDVYTYDQSVLLASKNNWNPRPVIQSYAAYTPLLATLNEQHLRGAGAPDWLLFDVQTIDKRLPSLDDGLSWPALMDNYTFDSFDGQFVLLRKNRSNQRESKYQDVLKETCKTGAAITIPETSGLLFAEVNLKPTLAGRLLIALFNPPELHIVLGLKDGETKTYRVVSNMMSTGFLLSPLIDNTKELASLLSNSKTSEEVSTVKSISITPAYGGSTYWSGTYELALKRYTAE